MTTSVMSCEYYQDVFCPKYLSIDSVTDTERQPLVTKIVFVFSSIIKIINIYYVRKANLNTLGNTKSMNAWTFYFEEVWKPEITSDSHVAGGSGTESSHFPFAFSAYVITGHHHNKEVDIDSVCSRFFLISTVSHVLLCIYRYVHVCKYIYLSICNFIIYNYIWQPS